MDRDIVEIAQWIVGTVVAVLTLVLTIKLAASFDINRWLEKRRERAKERVKILCPHALLERADDGTFNLVSLFQLQTLTTWVCGRCQLRTNDSEMVRRLMQEFAKDPDMFVKREKLYQKHVKKYLGI